MNTQSIAVELDTFFREVRTAPCRVLLLDYDGILAPLRVDGANAAPYPEVRELLNIMVRADHTRLVIISGRSVHDVWRLLNLWAPLEIWGGYGAERLLPHGSYTGIVADERAAMGLVQAAVWAERSGLGVHCEQKSTGIAFHWRSEKPEVARHLRDLAIKAWLPLTRGLGLALHEFDGGVELCLPQYTKGLAVRRILAEEGPMAVVAYLGNDLTDEDAFRALNRHGLSVLVRDEPCPTAARHWLRPPDELLAFLKRWHETATGVV